MIDAGGTPNSSTRSSCPSVSMDEAHNASPRSPPQLPSQIAPERRFWTRHISPGLGGLEEFLRIVPQLVK
jgi:hypothetical protein